MRWASASARLPGQAASRRRSPWADAPRTSSALSRIGSVPDGIGLGRVTTTSGVRPVLWIQRLSGVSQRAIVSLNAPPSPVSSCHCWTVPLPNDWSPTRVARFVSWRAPGDDLAGGRAAAVDEADDLELRVGRHAVAQGLGGDLGALRVLLPEDDAGRDELAGDLARRRDVAARVAPEVQDELRPAGLDVGGEGVGQLVGGGIGEAGQPDVPDRPAGEDLAVDLLLLDDVAGDRDLERTRRAALDRERHDRALGAADLVARRVDGQPIERDAVRLEDEVAGLESGALGRRSGQRAGDEQMTVRPEGWAALRAVRGLRRDLGADPLELAADPLQARGGTPRR